MPQLIHMKFCAMEDVGKIIRYVKNGCNRLTGDGPTGGWNVASKLFLLYLALPFLFLPSLCNPDGLTDEHV
jgi:hypothetical protein